MAARIAKSRIEHIVVDQSDLPDALCGRYVGPAVGGKITRPLAEVPITKVCQHCRRVADQITAALEQATT